MSDFGLHFYNARWYDSSLGRFAQADTLIPENQGVQAWDRYAYVNSNPLRSSDPTGHEKCEEVSESGDCVSHDLDFKGYTGWERKILRKLYDQGGPNAVHGVMYILENDIHISVGGSFTSGDWQSLGNIAGWYDRKAKSIVLNPNAGYKPGQMPSTWGLATIIHEAKHLEQGAPLTKYKELEGALIGIDVAIHLGGYYGGTTGKPGQLPNPNSRDGRVYALTLSHDPETINRYSEILRNDPDSYWYWFFYNFLPIDSPRPSP